MGLRGPAPTPSRLLALRGSRRASRPNEPVPEVVLPPAPDWLSDDAKAAYAHVGERLLAQEVVTLLDQNALARYATLWVRYRRCEEFVSKHGEAYVVRARPRLHGELGDPIGFKTYPQAKLALVLSGELLRLEREFGMTPSARARLAAAVPLEDEPGSEFDYFSPPSRTG